MIHYQRFMKLGSKPCTATDSSLFGNIAFQNPFLSVYAHSRLVIACTTSCILLDGSIICTQQSSTCRARKKVLTVRIQTADDEDTRAKSSGQIKRDQSCISCCLHGAKLLHPLLPSDGQSRIGYMYCARPQPLMLSQSQKDTGRALLDFLLSPRGVIRRFHEGVVLVPLHKVLAHALRLIKHLAPHL